MIQRRLASLTESTANSRYLQIEKNLSDVDDQGEARVNLLVDTYLGECHITTAAGTSCTLQSTWYALAGTWAADVLEEISHSGGVLTNDGDEERTFMAVFNGAVRSSAPGLLSIGIGVESNDPTAPTTRPMRVGGTATCHTISVPITLDAGESCRVMVSDPNAAGTTVTAEIACGFTLFAL